MTARALRAALAVVPDDADVPFFVAVDGRRHRCGDAWVEKTGEIVVASDEVGDVVGVTDDGDEDGAEYAAYPVTGDDRPRH